MLSWAESQRYKLLQQAKSGNAWSALNDSHQVAGKRWRIDLKSRQDAALMLSAVNLPGGIQVNLVRQSLFMHAQHGDRRGGGGGEGRRASGM